MTNVYTAIISKQFDTAKAAALKWVEHEGTPQGEAYFDEMRDALREVEGIMQKGFMDDDDDGESLINEPLQDRPMTTHHVRLKIANFDRNPPPVMQGPLEVILDEAEWEEYQELKAKRDEDGDE